MNSRINLSWREFLALAALLAMGQARAGDLNVILPMPESPLYVQECGSCHTAYAPTYLPAASWRRLMNNLERHFDADASLPPAQRDLLLQQLEALAGDGPRAVPAIAYRNGRVSPTNPPIRITEMPFFGFMHDEVPNSIWRRKQIGSKANCVACHGRADEGRYFEREIVIPK